MDILLCNTGRGGEQCIFTSIVHAYSTRFPDAKITVGSCPQYESLWKNNQDIVKWLPIQYEEGDRFPGDPVNAAKLLLQDNRDKFDILEYAAECQSNKSANDERSTLRNCYDAIADKKFPFDYIEPRVWVYPSMEEIEEAKKFKRLCGRKPIILLAPGANSAKRPLSVPGFQMLSDAFQEFDKYTVAYSGTTGRNHMPADPEITSAKDLRDISYGALFSMRNDIALFVGMDSALCWLLSGMKGNMIVLRNDPSFSIYNTGIVNMGYREAKNTIEFEGIAGSDSDIVARIIQISRTKL